MKVSAREALVDFIWELTDGAEENAQTGEVTMTLTRDQAREMYGDFWRIGGRYRRGLKETGWSPTADGEGVKS